jgi:hypothetical protein
VTADCFRAGDEARDQLCALSVLFLFPDVFTPSFVELTSSDCEENLKTLRLAGVDFPFGEFIFTLVRVCYFNLLIAVLVRIVIWLPQQ